MAFVRRVLGLTVGALSFAYLIFILNPIQMLSVVLRPFSKPAFRAVNRWCARSIWGFWVLQGEVMNGIEVRFTGDRCPKRESAIILPNHQSMADVMVLLCFAWRCGRLGDTKWFVKDVIKYFPGFGWGLEFLDSVFVKRDWALDKGNIQRLFGKYREEQIPLFLISFLEGTRRTPEKLARSQEFARSRGMPIPAATLVPRTKGFVATVEGLREHVDAVYDVTIGYPGRTPTLVNCYEARVPRIEVHVRRHPIESLPREEEALVEWVQARFREKDALMVRFEADQKFPGAEWPSRVRLRDWFVPERRLRLE